MALNKRTRAAGESLTFLLVVGGILVALNVLGVFFFGRLDLTDNRLFSLSDGSKRLAASLKDDMEIVAYFTEDLPPPFNATERYVRDILAEYAAASKGKIKVRFVNPDTDDERQAAERDGVQRVQHQAIENDSVSVKEGYRGLVIKYLGDNRAMPVIEDTSGLEYRITQTFKELVGDKRPVGVLSGHEGPTVQKGLSAIKRSLPTYDLREVSANQAIPKDLAALLVIGPETALSDDELKNINTFVMEGGSLGVFGGTLKANLEGQMGPTAEAVDSKINTLLKPWGMKLRSELLGDWQCSRAPMRGPFGITVAVPYPAVPILAFNDEQQEHPVLFRLTSAMMPFTTAVERSGTLRSNNLVKLTTLARSSENSWLMKTEGLSLAPRHPREWPMDGKQGPFALAMAAEGKLPSAFGGAAMSSDSDGDKGPNGPARAAKKVRVLVVGSSTFLRDELLPQEDPSGQQNLNAALAFALNAVDWLAEESDLIAIRAKTVDDPALEVPTGVREAEDAAKSAAEGQDKKGVEKALEKRKQALAAWDSKKDGYRWANTLGVPFLFAIFGVVRWRLRNAKKQNLKI